MMHGRGKSGEAIVALKPANKAERSAAESGEPRAEAEGNAGQQSTCRAQNRISVSPALVGIRRAFAVGPEVGAVCGKAARTVLCGGREVTRVPTAPARLRAVPTRPRLNTLRCCWRAGSIATVTTRNAPRTQHAHP